MVANFTEDYMFDYSILHPEGVLVIKSDKLLSKQNFVGLSSFIDSYLFAHSKLRGILLLFKELPGWENAEGFNAHMRFVNKYHEKVARIALVTDTPLTGITDAIGKHFTTGKVKHFAFADNAKALDWLQSPQ
jgi:hypothetical protein